MTDKVPKLITTISRQVHTGPDGLNIPKLSSDASDIDVLNALDNLEMAKQKLLKYRKQIEEDALNLFKTSDLFRNLQLRIPLAEEDTQIVYDEIKNSLKDFKEGITCSNRIGDI